MTHAQTRSNKLYWVRDNIIASDFPDVSHALSEPDGLLAIGGDLSPERMISAYARGIFPWYNEGQPILWWSPDPRWILLPDQLKISRSLYRSLNRKKFRITFDQCFQKVMEMCAGPRSQSDGTWITIEMIRSFTDLHKLGYAHSVECWHGDELVGGLYGMAIDRVFFGESMFSRMSDASKVALVYLCRLLNQSGFTLIDCQVYSKHLQSLGAQPVSREHFAVCLERDCRPGIKSSWPEQPLIT